ncbi:MAG: hypothetical protein AB7D27_02955 [Desulfomicrobium sp.]
MKNIKANPYLAGGQAPFPIARFGSINPYLGRDPNPFPINRVGSINPNHQLIMAQGEPTGQGVTAEATIVMAARARRRRRQNQRLQANDNQVIEA